MNDQNIHKKSIRSRIPNFGFFKSLNFFFMGLGISFLISYEFLKEFLDKKEMEFKEELKKLREVADPKLIIETKEIPSFEIENKI